jgi:ribonucleoside-diphosphate reductase alpha chain
MKEIYRQVRGISSDKVMGLGANKILSVPDAVGIALERYMAEKQGIQQELIPGASEPGAEAEAAPVARMATTGEHQAMLAGMAEALTGSCPDCNSQLEYAEGCVKCHVCGYSECG